MNAALVLARSTFSFLAGATTLAASFGLIITVAVARSDVSNGTPTRGEYLFMAAALILLALGFAAGTAILRGATPSLLPARIAGIAGAGAVTLLLVSGMLIGQLLGMSGGLAVAFAAGMLSAGVAIRAWHSRHVPAAAVVR